MSTPHKSASHAQKATGNALSAALSGFSYLVGLHVLSRVVSFVLNVAIAKTVGPAVYGVASVQFHLVLNSVLFLAREGCRKACLRATRATARERVDLMHLTLPIAMGGCLLLYYSMAAGCDTDTGSGVCDGVYSHAVLVILASCVMEILSEPVYVLLSAEISERGGLAARVRIELGAVLCRSTLTYVLICLVEFDQTLSFAYGQLGYALFLTGGLYTFCVMRARGPVKDGMLFAGIRDILPRISSTELRRDSEILVFAGQFSVQSVEKFILTEGEKLVLLSSLASDQGIYGLVSNLGSLVARFVLQPLEEVGYVLFGRLHGDGNDATALHILEVLLRLVILLGGVFVSFGPNYSFIFIDIIYGSTWSASEAPSALSWYCVYVLVISVNGICEAFVHSTAPASQLAWYNKVFVPLAIAYLGVAYMFVRSAGVSGLIAANTINMVSRIVLSLSFVLKLSRSSQCKQDISLVPSPWVIASYTLCFIVTGLSEQYFGARIGQDRKWSLKAKAGHIGVGIVCLGALGLALIRLERSTINGIRWMRSLKNQQAHTKDD